MKTLDIFQLNMNKIKTPVSSFFFCKRFVYSLRVSNEIIVPESKGIILNIYTVTFVKSRQSHTTARDLYDIVQEMQTFADTVSMQV